MIFIDVNEIIKLQKNLIKSTGGRAGIRDFGLLDSAVNSVLQSCGEKDAYPTIIEKASRLCYTLISDHAFHDGNKRIGILAMKTLLEINNKHLECSDQDLIYLGEGVEKGKIKYPGILNFVKSHLTNLEK